MLKREVAVITGAGLVQVIKEKVPELQDGQALVKVKASLVSPGTEMSTVKGRREKPEQCEPTRFGYANAGDILEVKGDAKGLTPGMRVACMGAGAALHANYAVVPVNMIVPIPDAVSYAQASYACLGATALQALRRAEPTLGEYGAVLGLGIVGNLCSQLCALSGARVVSWEALPARMKIAAACGLKNRVNFKDSDPVAASKDFAAPYGLDFAVIAFGGQADQAYASLKQCMKVSADGHAMGRVVLVGGCKITMDGGAANGNLDIRISSRTGPGYHDPAYELGKSYPAGFVQFDTQRNLREIIALIAEGRLLVDPMTTHTLPLSEAAQAADALLESPDKTLGVVFEMKH